MEKYKLVNNKEAKRYEYHIDGFRPHVEYRIKDDVIALTHTRIPEELRGQGIGSMLVKDVLDDVAEKNLKVIPICAFVASYIKKHPQYKRLLEETITVG